MKITDRDIAGLTLCADQYGAPADFLAAALDLQAERLRAILARGGTPAGETGVLGKGPAWCWLTPAGMRLLGLTYSRPGTRRGPAGPHPRRAGRPALATER